MGSHSAERPKWFENEKKPATDPVPLVQMFGPPMPDYQPGGHTGIDFTAPRRKTMADWRRSKRRVVTEQMLAIMFGIAIGFFIAGIVYIQLYQGSLQEAFREAALLFTGIGMVCSGIIAFSIAIVHIYRVRKDQ